MTGLFSGLIKFIIKQSEVECFLWKIYYSGITFSHVLMDWGLISQKDGNARGSFVKVNFFLKTCLYVQCLN